MFSSVKPLSKVFYVIGVVVVFLAVYSQYFLPLKSLGVVVSYLIVYGLPIVVVTVFFGKQLLSRAAKNNGTAFKQGLGLFGGLTFLGFFLSFIALAIILQFDPNAADLLTRPNPALDVSPRDAWILIAVSLLVIGPAEEYLFRGFMYGGLLSIFKGRHWLPLAVASSLLFSIVHAYYAVTYGVASIVPFIDIVAFGVAMSVTYYWSGGNLLAPAVIHGLYDATGFLGVATSTNVGLAARFILIGVGVVFAIFYLIMKKIRINPAEVSERPEEKKPEAGAPASQ